MPIQGRSADRGPHPAARAVFGVAFLATLLISVRLISGGASSTPTLAGTKAPVHGGYEEGVTRPSVLKPLAPVTRPPRAKRNASGEGPSRLPKVWTALATPRIEEPLQRLPTWRPPTISAADAANGQRIPRVMYTTWKTNVLPPRARELMAVWRWREPDWSWRTLSDRECDTLVQPYPDLRDAYRALRMPVMRADICRMLILYAYGGAYRDLDVAWVEPLSTWLNLSSPIVYGREDGPHLCQWFLAAEPRNPCIGHAIDVITELIADVDFDFERNPELVIDSTGPGAFTKAMALCPTKETLTIDDMTKAKVRHEFAAMNWRSEKHGYASWLEQRRNMMGWVDIFHNSDADRFVKGYLFRPSGELLAPLDTGRTPPLHVVVWQTSHRFGERLRYFPASLAVDRNLDTYSMTENTGLQSWVLQADTDHQPSGIFDVSCVRVWNKRRLHDAEFFEEFALEVLPPRGDWVPVYPPAAGPAAAEAAKGFGSRTGSASFMIRVAELMRPNRKLVSVRGIRIVKNDPAKAERKAILLGEVELFSDDGACTNARALEARGEVEAAPHDVQDRWLTATEMMLADLRRPREVVCENTVGVSGEWGMQHALCVDAVEQSRSNRNGDGNATEQQQQQPGRVVVVTDFGRLDAMFARTLQQRLNCRIEVFTSQPFKQQDSTPPNTRLVRLVSLQAKDDGKVPAPVTRHGEQKSSVPPALSLFEMTLVPAALVLLDAGPRNWEFLEDAITAAMGGRIDALMTELCLQPEAVGVEATLEGTQRIHARLRSLLDGYAMLWWDVAPHSSMSTQGGIEFPACVQLSMVRKGLVPLLPP